MARRFDPGDMDVVVGLFDGETVAEQGLDEVKRAVHDKTLYVHDAALVVHDPDSDKVHIKDTVGMSVLPGGSIGLLIGAVVGAPAGPLGFAAAAAAGAFIGGVTGYEMEHPTHEMVKEIAESLVAGQAGVVAVAPRGGDAPAVAEILRRRGADVREVALDEAAVKSILGGDGSGPAMPTGSDAP